MRRVINKMNTKFDKDRFERMLSWSKEANHINNSSPTLAGRERESAVDDIYYIQRNIRRQGNHIYFYDYIDEETQTKTLDTEVSQNVLKDFVPKAQTWDWTDENLHEKLADFRAEWKEKGVKPKVTMWAIRAAVTGRTFGADMVGILDVIGKEKTLARANKAIK